MNLISKMLGPPSETNWPGMRHLPWARKYVAPAVQKREPLKSIFSDERPGLVALLTVLLQYDPKERLNAGEALAHRYFGESPAGCPIVILYESN